MKNYKSILLAMTMIIVSIAGCKKDTPKDYTISIRDKSWWGTLTYAGKPAEYYSVHFNTDNSLSWSQLSGDYPGEWSVNGKRLTMTFPLLGSEITADILDDTRLGNFSDNNASVIINTGQLIPTPGILIDNTTWKGTVSIGGNPTPLQLNFLPSSKLDIKVGNVLYPQTYIRIAAGGAIRSNNGFFGVITAANEMKGSDTNPDRPWQITKL